MYISIAIYSLLFYSSRVRSNNSHPLLHPGGFAPAGLRGMHAPFGGGSPPGGGASPIGGRFPRPVPGPPPKGELV